MEYESVKDELLSVADTGLKFAAKQDGSAEFEVYVHYGSVSLVELDQGVVTAKDGVVAGCAVRVAKGKRLGFASASGVTATRVKQAVKESLSVVNSVSAEDDKFGGFCDPKKAGRECRLNKDILGLEVDELIRHCQDMTKEARDVDSRVKVVTASCRILWDGYAVANSRGIEQASRSGSNRCRVDVMSIEGDERKTGLRHDAACDRLIRTEGLGEQAAKEAVGQHNGKKLGLTSVLPTLWGPEAAGAYILSSFGQAALGRAVVEHTSPLCDMMGAAIASHEFTLVDEGQRPDGLGTESIDAEGHPQKRNPIVENGVLKGFLFNTYYGRLFGVGSTGNCSRGGGPFGTPIPYESTVGVSGKALEVSPGSKTPDELVSSIDGKAILITDDPMGIFHSTMSTGQFSVVANRVYLIESGSTSYPLQPVSVAGNYYDGFKKLRGVGNDASLGYYRVRSPSLLFDGFTVVG